MALKQPIPFGKYLLLDRISIGGMAEVWQAQAVDPSDPRLYAIKRLLPNISEDADFVRMFHNEALLGIQLRHKNLVRTYEFGQVHASHFIAMEYLAGKDLRAVLREGQKGSRPLSTGLACHAIAQLCAGLDYAHRFKDAQGGEMNIVHQDVSLQNVLLGYEGEVKLIDFGIANAGPLKGKQGYMSPEQARGSSLDRRSDIYSVGVCLYQVLTGKQLGRGESCDRFLEQMGKIQLPESLKEVVRKCLAPEVEDRYSHAGEVAGALEEFSDSTESLSQYMKSTFAREWESGQG